MNPIILLHGALGANTQLEPLANRLKSSGRDVYTLNFSGHGGVPFQPSFGIETFAGDVLHFMDQQHLTCVDFFGYSMGGYVALYFAHLHPHRTGKIVTLGTKFDWSPESAAREIAKMNADKIQEKVPAFARILEHRHAPNDWKLLLGKTSGMMHQLGQQPLLPVEIFKRIPHTVYILLGDQDDMADRNYSMEVTHYLPHGQFELLANTPHSIEKVNLDILMNSLQE